MLDWDADSPVLRKNLATLLRRILVEARRRDKPSLASARNWHREFMSGLTVPNPAMVGEFRGEPGLLDVEVRIGHHRGIAPAAVAQALSAFERRLQQAVKRLDELIPPDSKLSVDQLAAVIELCSWAHAEWVRIHPFANGNGRTARLWANSIAMRYGLPPFVQLRPRPGGGYGSASEAAMRGDWSVTFSFFRVMLDEAFRRA
jgi:Fic family protein